MRRWGRKIRLKGRYHDAARSQTGHVATSEGIQWLRLKLLVPSPWSARHWVLPALTVPTRSPALSRKLRKRHRTAPEHAETLIALIRRWQPGRELLVVGDSTFATAGLGRICRRLGVRLVSRLLLTAQLYDPVPPQPKGKPGVKPKKGPRQPKLTARLTDATPTAWEATMIDWYAGQRLAMNLATGTARWHRDGEEPLPLRWVLLRDPSTKRQPVALFCTDQDAAARQIIAWYVSRWETEVTFEEARAHLGFQSQRHWSPLAVARTTPCLLGLFSLTVLLASRLDPSHLPTRQAAWYAKVEPTFVDVLAAVRRHLWVEANAPTRRAEATTANPRPSSSTLLDMLVQAACYAA